MNPLANVSKNAYYQLQGSAHPCYREPCETEPGSKIVCSKTVIKEDAHCWTLKGSRIFEKVVLCAYDPGTLRVEANIRASFIQDNFNDLKINIIPQFGQFGKSFFIGQINSGIPQPIEQVRKKAEDLLDVVCKVEGLASGSLQFMLDQCFHEGECEDKTVELMKKPLSM